MSSSLLLVACGPLRPFVRTEVIEVKVPAWVPLDEALTSEIDEPRAPPARCRDKRGNITVCNRELANDNGALRTALRQANGKLRKIRELQPTSADTDSP